MDDEIWHSGNPDHAVRCQRQNCPSPGWRAARTDAAGCRDPVHGGCKPIVNPHEACGGGLKEGGMKKIALPVIAALILGACLPSNPTPNTGPTVDFAGTADAAAKTSVAQTLTALPTITVAPVTDTATPPILLPSDTATVEPFTATV